MFADILLKYYTAYCLRQQFDGEYREFLCKLNEPWVKERSFVLKKMYEILQGLENLSLDIWLEEIATLKRNILCQVDNEEHFVKGLCSENSSTAEWKCLKTMEEELFLQEKPKGTIYDVKYKYVLE